MASFYDFSVKDIKRNETSLKEYAGKVVLVVNVASKCGYTRQYEGLQKIWTDHKDKGLVILGFPCNQFGGQEPGTNEEIVAFCSSKYSVTFPLFDKVDVNGANQAPLYTFLKKSVSVGDIAWNFEKFLIDKNGKVVKHFKSGVTPEKLVPEIAALL